MVHDEHMNTLKQLVTILRNRDYSQARIGRIAGVSQMTVSRWEKDNPKRIDMKALRRLELEVKESK